MPDHIGGRAAVLDALRRELVGPSPSGTSLNTADDVHFPDFDSAAGPWRDEESDEEILQRDPPGRRYGVGVLYPPRIAVDPGDLLASSGGEAPAEDSLAEQVPELVTRRGTGASDDADFDLSAANDYRPSTIGLSFLAVVGDRSDLSIVVRGGQYRPFRVTIGDRPQRWWTRRPVEAEVHLTGSQLLARDVPHILRETVSPEDAHGLSLEVVAFVRPWGKDQRLITVTLVNRSVVNQDALDASCLFQTEVTVRLHDDYGVGEIMPYPDRRGETADPEVASFDLLYRDARTFAVGHGCAAGWRHADGPCRELHMDVLPTVQTPSITPVIHLDEGARLEVPLAPLADLVPEDDGVATLEQVLREYETWIAARRRESGTLTPVEQETAKEHLRLCAVALGRMRRGLTLLRTNPQVGRAFQLANEAMLYQQLRSGRSVRKTSIDKQGRFKVDGTAAPEPWQTANRAWRPFQIGFMLSVLDSVANPESADREVVELIFFPTGGGKTEAYLGIAAFAMFLRRLRLPADSGVEVLMRYTLRLLTAQQFTRAASLLCAMETIRQREADLGDAQFSIGMWVGGSTAPNLRSQAKSALRALNRADRDAENPFVLLRCPWCAAQMGPVDSKTRLKVAGYVEDRGTVGFRCPDSACFFNRRDGLPVVVIDEDIYDTPPSLILGTVDKFALLAWKPEARALFGIGNNGERTVSPPGTIIQDELHLISGPLGSMVGLFEGVIEELCTDRRNEQPVRPKIITSTATIRRYAEQISALYDRKEVALFPPHGLDAADSFFARYARDEEGALREGRMYVGVHAPGLGSIQTAQVRTFASLLQAARDQQPEARDPWWTLVSFFNSLRELGTSLTLLQSDIPDYLNVLRNRYGLSRDQLRNLSNVKELTSRLRQDEIPRAIEDLERSDDDAAAVDVCLASSIIEVGVDIDRLSLMCVVGQPKSTSQYIQVTGRVGRKWEERPGLVITIYGASKPRDRSHFERFRSYHERLYAQVEPTSVTPFAPPVLDRALHAALTAAVRQLGPRDLGPWPVPETVVDRASGLFKARAASVDAREESEVMRVLARRVSEWRSWERTDWEAHGGARQGPLLRRAGEWVPDEIARISWPTPTSMRDVDAECQVDVTTAYLDPADQDE